MRHPLSPLRLLPLLAVLGTGCLIDTEPPPAKNPCDPSPCTQQGKTTCVNENGTARCLCDPGTVARPSGACEPVSAANCAEHPGDAFEPDDCLSRAAPLALSSQRQQSIEPIGDYDFFKLDATLRHVYTVTVEPGQGSLMPRVDVFDQAGVWMTSQDGRPKAQVSFKARATAPYYVRMSHSPVDPSAATGLYALSLSSLGQEDHGDSSTEPTNIIADVGGTAPSSLRTHSGKLEYGQDVDWFALAATQGYTYRIDFKNLSGYYVPTLAGFTREDVKEPFLTIRNSFVEIRAATTTTLYLVMYSPQGDTGSYAFQVQYYR
jgi:hypothetical protein